MTEATKFIHFSDISTTDVVETVHIHSSRKNFLKLSVQENTNTATRYTNTQVVTVWLLRVTRPYSHVEMTTLYHTSKADDTSHHPSRHIHYNVYAKRTSFKHLFDVCIKKCMFGGYVFSYFYEQ